MNRTNGSHRIPQRDIFKNVVFPEDQALIVRPEQQVTAQSLTELAERQILPYARHLGFPIVFDGVAPIPTHPVLVPARPYSWLVMAAEDNPLYGSCQVPYPAKHYHQLQAMAQGGLNFPFIYEAHEVYPEDGGIVKTEKRIPIRAVAPKLDFAPLKQGLDSVGRSVSGLVKTSPLGKVVVYSAVGSLAVMALMALLPLDPRIYGVVPANGLGAWFRLAEWVW